MTDKEIVDKIHIGTLETATRKEVTEANLLFTEIKSEIESAREILQDFANKLHIGKEVYFNSIIGFDLDIEIIEKLLNPKFTHSENTKKSTEPKKTKHNPNLQGIEKLLKGYRHPTNKEKINEILEYRKRLLESLKFIYHNISDGLHYINGLIKIEPEKKLNFSKKTPLGSVDNFSNDSFDYFSEGRYCGACMSSPCMCSDPEQTSTVY